MHEDAERRQERLDTADILWGGPRGPGLVYTVAELSKAVSNLVTTVLGDAGMQGDVRELKGAVSRIDARVERSARFIERWGMPVIIALALIGFTSVILLGRIVSLAITGRG